MALGDALLPGAGPARAPRADPLGRRLHRPRRCGARIGLAFEACARLILADRLRRLPPRRRLAVVASDLHGRRVGWLDERGQGTLGRHPNPLAEALALLEPLRIG